MWQAHSSCVAPTHLGGFKQVDRLAKDLAEVTTIDLVDDEKEGASSGLAYRSRKRSFANSESERSFVGVGRQTYDEVLVGYGGVELDRHAGIVKERSSDRVCQGGVAGFRGLLVYEE